MRKLTKLLFLALAALCSAPLANRLAAQGLTGRISGVVQDPSGASVAGADLTLRNVNTSQTSLSKSDEAGGFLFTNLLPGTYQVAVSAKGFRTFHQDAIVLTAAERIALRPISLTVGEVSESVTVTAEGARLQTESAERAGLVSMEQVQQIPLKGRDYMATMRLLPGVVDTVNRESPRDNGVGVNINGNRGGTTNVTLDGTTQMDTGNQSWPLMTPAPEALQEVKVLLSNYQAEYGRSATSVNAVSRAGTKDLHFGAYYYKRNEVLNANDFFNNRNLVRRPRYRYDYPGYYVGGPILLPRVNKNRDKLFFFWSQEFLPRLVPSSLNRRTAPTALERRGDFTQSYDTGGAVIRVNDPANNKAQFPGNIVPSSRIDPRGQTLLNFFPQPNSVDPTRNYNYLWQNVVENWHHLELLRVDWNISPTMTFYARGVASLERQTGEACCIGGNNYPHLKNSYDLHAKTLAGTLIKTFNPTLVNELNIGVSRQIQFLGIGQDSLDRNSRAKVGVNLPQFYPSANPLNLLPNASFGGVPNAIALSYESRFPFFGTGTIWNYADNLTKIAGAHQFKFGFFAEIVARNAARSSSFNGSYDFGRNQVNPYDSNYAFANAVLGSINAYTESNIHPEAYGRYRNVEWYAQDNWKVARRFTLEFGVRFYRIAPTRFGGGQQIAAFDPAAYDPAQAPQLIRPYKNPATGERLGQNPVTGEIVPQVKIGTFAPGAGTIYTGLKVYPGTSQETPGIKAAPRFGFATDVFGDGKTVVRGGFGIFFDRISDDTFIGLVESAPLVKTATANYTTITNLLSTPLSLSPPNVTRLQIDYQPPTVMNWSFGIQRSLGFGTVFDVAYVGSGGRHLLQSQDTNGYRHGTNFLPSSQDATNPGQPLPVNFLRPIRGLGSINYIQFGSPSNYHSLQTQVNRRFTRNLTFGLVWTWAKAMERGSSVANFLDNRSWNYSVTSFDRTHVVVANFIYSLPKLSATWKSPVARWGFDEWQVSGVGSFYSGGPSGIGYSFVNAIDITGGASVDSRVSLTGNPNLPSSKRSPWQWFDTSVVRPPTQANFGIGNAGRYPLRLPGINNWDLAVSKNFPWGKRESRYVQFRGEFYNAFNHTQYTSIDTGSRWDAAGRQVNTQFGQATGSANARRIQLGLKLTF